LCTISHINGGTNLGTRPFGANAIYYSQLANSQCCAEHAIPCPLQLKRLWRSGTTAVYFSNKKRTTTANKGSWLLVAAQLWCLTYLSSSKQWTELQLFHGMWVIHFARCFTSWFIKSWHKFWYHLHWLGWGGGKIRVGTAGGTQDSGHNIVAF
jgi:hypothetical protein